MSAKVTDGWSLRALQKLLRVGPDRLRYLIGHGLLRVRDAHITAASLAAFCEKNRETWEPSIMATVTIGLREDDAFSWEKVADLLAIDMAKVQGLIAAGELKLADTFVTDRAFEEFCKKHSDEISIALIDPATAKWLIQRVWGFTIRHQCQHCSPCSKTCLSGQSLQVWKEDSRQPLLPAYQNLPIDESIACPTCDVIVDGPIVGFDGGIGAASIHGLVDVRIGIPSPFLKGWVRIRQFRAPSLAAVVREFHGPNGPRMAPHLSENSVKPPFRFGVLEKMVSNPKQQPLGGFSRFS